MPRCKYLGIGDQTILTLAGLSPERAIGTLRPNPESLSYKLQAVPVVRLGRWGCVLVKPLSSPEPNDGFAY